MATQNYVSGASSAIKYGYETTFGTAVSPTYPFGWGTTVSVKKNNNLERINGLGSRNAQFTVAKKFEGTMTIEFVLGHPYWLKAVLGDQGVAGGGGPYTHAFTETNNPSSLTVSVCADLGTNDMVTTYTGVVINSAKFNLSVGEPIKVSLDCAYSSESTALTGVFAQPQMDDDFDGTGNWWLPLTFAHGSVTYAGQVMGSGSPNIYSGVVQSMDLTINNNTEMIFGLGSRLSRERVSKIREYNISMDYALGSVGNAADVYPNVLGDTAAAYEPAAGNITGVNLVLTISNGLGTTDLRSLVWTFTAAKTFFNTSNMNFDVNEVLKDSVDGWAESISSCVWTDNTNDGIGPA